MASFDVFATKYILQMCSSWEPPRSRCVDSRYIPPSLLLAIRWEWLFVRCSSWETPWGWNVWTCYSTLCWQCGLEWAPTNVFTFPLIRIFKNWCTQILHLDPMCDDSGFMITRWCHCLYVFSYECEFSNLDNIYKCFVFL